MEPVKTLPPDEIPTDPPVMVPHPAPFLPPMNWQEKPIWKSRTMLALAVAIAAMVAKFFGIDVDLTTIADDHVLTLGELVTVLMAVAAGWFRIDATGPLTKPGKPKPAGG